ncbi:hypothetical protein BKI52_29060 [marine bacterium AO1-C]|nr:hypothetical protein BKI52_29060 [marine bacterium AO1-C]
MKKIRKALPFKKSVNKLELNNQELQSIKGGAKETFDRSKPHVNIGTIGHVDHGKTSKSTTTSSSSSSAQK